MNEQLQADALAAWLDAGGGPVPEGLDPEVLEAVYALRPDLAPAPRLRIDDLFAELTEGPLAKPTARVIEFPERATPPAAAGLPIAVVEVVDDEEDDAAGGIVIPLRPETRGAPVDLAPSRTDRIPVEGATPGRRSPWGRVLLFGGAGVAAAAAALLVVGLPGGGSSDEAARVGTDANLAAPQAAPAAGPVIAEAEPAAEEPEAPTRATPADARAVMSAAKAGVAGLSGLLGEFPEITEDLAAKGDAVADAAADAAEVAAPAGAPPPPAGAYAADQEGLSVTAAGRGGGGAAGNTADEVIAEAEQAATRPERAAAKAAAAPAPKEEAPAATRGDAVTANPMLVRARDLESRIQAPAATGQTVALEAAQAALDAGDAAYALTLIKKGLALGGQGTPERARLEALQVLAQKRAGRR